MRLMPHYSTRVRSTASIYHYTMRAILVVALAALALIAVASPSSASSVAAQLFAHATNLLGGNSVSTAKATHAGSAMVADESSPEESSSSLSGERRGHTATRLADGRVLIAGGENSSGALNQTEIYDPSSQTFSVSGNMGDSRADHTATLLSDGRVLIAGGHNGAGPLATSEIFDPTTGAFTSGPNMSVARAGHSATLFADGRILFAGGNESGSAEIMNAGLSGSSSVGSMGAARSMHSAALLQDGRVLIVGGRDAGGNDLLTGEIFDSASGAFSAVQGELKVSRVRAHLRVLFDGKVQIIGGGNDGSMEIYDPSIATFGAYAHVVPESDPCIGLHAHVLASEARAALFHNGQSDPMFDRSGHTITELGSQALVIGGANSSGAVLNSSAVVASSSASLTTDKLDYQPGETVLISGRGFAAGETVRVKIHEDPHTPQERGFDAVADSDGNFSGEYLVMDYDLDMKFIVGARGLTSGRTAQTTFSDARLNTLTVGAQSPDPVTAGNAATYTVTVGFNGNANNCTVDLTVSGLPTGATGSFGTNPVTGSGVVDIASLLTINTTGLTPGGSHNFTVSGSTRTGCQNHPATIDANATLVVAANVATTTAVTSSASPSVFGQPVTFTATVTPASGSSAPTGSVQFKIDGVDFGSPVTLSPSGSNGVANSDSISTLNVADSPHEITAVYTPTGSFTGSTSPVFNQVVNKADQTITVTTNAPANAVYNTTFNVAATASSGLDVAITVSGVCTIQSGGTNSATILMTSGTGTCTVHYNQAGDDNYNAAPEVTENVTAQKADQTITVTMNAPANAVYNTTFDVAATASSGLDVAITVSGVCSIQSGGTNSATILMTSGTGTCTVHYNQAGDDNYNAAPEVTENVTAQKADQTITVTTNAPANAVYNTTFNVAATASSGLDVAITVSGVCTIQSGGTNSATILMTSGTGTCTVHYNQAGDDNYNAAPEVTENVTAQKADQTITVTTNAPANAVYNTTFNVAATASSGLDVAITVSGVCSIQSGGTNSATILMTSGTGTCTVHYNQAGDDNYNAAPEVTENVTAQKVALTITASSHTITFNDPVPTITASYLGFVAGDDPTDLTTQPTCSTTYTVGSIVGNYPSKCENAASPNYEFTYVDGTVTVLTACSLFNGFLSPIGGAVENGNTGGSYANPVRAFKLNSTIPVKFSAICFGQPLVTGVHTLQAIKYSNATDSDPAIDATPTDAATTGNQFRLTGTEWHFNMSTKGLGNMGQGTWLLKATLFDGSSYTVWVSIKK